MQLARRRWNCRSAALSRFEIKSLPLWYHLEPSTHWCHSRCQGHNEHPFCDLSLVSDPSQCSFVCIRIIDFSRAGSTPRSPFGFRNTVPVDYPGLGCMQYLEWDLLLYGRTRRFHPACFRADHSSDQVISFPCGLSLVDRTAASERFSSWVFSRVSLQLDTPRVDLVGLQQCYWTAPGMSYFHALPSHHRDGSESALGHALAVVLGSTFHFFAQLVRKSVDWLDISELW